MYKTLFVDKALELCLDIATLQNLKSSCVVRLTFFLFTSIANSVNAARPEYAGEGSRDPKII